MTTQSRSPRRSRAKREASTERRLAVVVQLFSLERRQLRARPHRILLADGAAHGVNAVRHQFLRIKGRPAREQFVEQHAQAVNVAARINVQPAHLRLFRAHVGRRANELMQLRVDRVVRQPAFGRLGDAEINHLGHRHAVMQRHQDVRRLDVAVDDALLVRVLDGVANLDEQLQAAAWWADCSGRSNR